MNAQDLKALRARVREATADDSDSYLFGEVMRALAPYTPGNPDALKFQGRFYRMLDAGAWESAALTLCERVIPGASVIVGTPGAYEGNPWARICKPNEGPLPEPFRAKAATPALAVLAALLSALSPGAGEQTEEGR